MLQAILTFRKARTYAIRQSTIAGSNPESSGCALDMVYVPNFV